LNSPTESFSREPIDLTISSLDQKIKALQTDSEASQQTFQKQISDLESKNDSSKQQEIYYDEKIKALERENQILKSLRSN
jgi:ribosomal protein L16 Arg81 hydroxylase